MLVDLELLRKILSELLTVAIVYGMLTSFVTNSLGYVIFKGSRLLNIKNN